MTTPPLDLPALRDAVTQYPSFHMWGSPLVARLLDRVEAAEVWTIAHPCVFAAMEPYDFKWCETHDRTFPLDGDCDRKGKSAIDWLDDRGIEQRFRAVQAEARAEAAERDLAAVTVSRDGWQTRAEAAEAAIQRVRDLASDSAFNAQDIYGDLPATEYDDQDHAESLLAVTVRALGHALDGVA